MEPPVNDWSATPIRKIETYHVKLRCKNAVNASASDETATPEKPGTIVRLRPNRSIIQPARKPMGNEISDALVAR